MAHTMQILVVEDDSVLSDGLRRVLDAHGMNVQVVADGGQADLLLRRPDIAEVVVLDIGLPGLDGIEVLRRLRARGSRLPVLLLTARDAVEDRVRGLETGADDYLVKPFDLHELAARLHALLRRAAGRSVDWIELGEVRINPAAGHIQRQGRTVELSRREWSLLRALLQSPGRILSTEQLRDSLYGYSQDVESNAVNVHVHHLRRKLGHELVETVRGEGYRLGLHP